VPAPGVEIDAEQATASLVADGVGLTVRTSAWRGNPWDLTDYVAPFLVSLTNSTASELRYDYPSFRLFDDSRFQYTALPPAEVERILRARVELTDRLVAISSPPPVVRRRVVPDPYWYPWGWGPYGWYNWPWAYPGSPPLDDVYLRALPMGPLQPGARLEGFVYFPRLRSDANGLTLQFHHQVGDQAPRVLTLPFAIERSAGS
jgi:hypothetical protein